MAKFKRTFELKNRLYVRYNIHTSGLTDGVGAQTLNLDVYYKSALRAQGWSVFKSGPMKTSASAEYRHSNGARMTFDIHGHSDWKRIKGKAIRFRFTHEYDLTFILPKGLTPESVLGPHYRQH